MNLQINSEGLPLPGTVENLLRKNFDQDLEKHLKHFEGLDLNPSVRVIKQARYGYKVIYELKLPNGNIYSEETDKSLHKAVHVLKYEVIRQIKRYKDKLNEY